jgi:ABC-type hemin transport system substrate-binding protein
VGVDRYSNWPASMASLPRVGGGLDPSIEAVVALKPDLVLLATSTRAAARLEALGIKVVALEPRNMADVRRVLAQVGRALGLPDADAQARLVPHRDRVGHDRAVDSAAFARRSGLFRSGQRALCGQRGLLHR